jgi:hypothetical protein
MNMQPISYAFPNGNGSTGMTLRDYFAMQALNGILANQAETIKDNDAIRAIAEFSYDIADAMIVARKIQSL